MFDREDRPYYAQIKGYDAPIVDEWELLYFLVGANWGSPKGHLIQSYMRDEDGKRKWFAKKYHDHGYTSSTTSRPVPAELAERAVQAHWVAGKPEWGYTSSRDYLISGEGEGRIYDRINKDLAELKAKKKAEADAAEQQKREEEQARKDELGADDLNHLW